MNAFCEHPSLPHVAKRGAHKKHSSALCMHTNAHQEREQCQQHKGCTDLPKRIDGGKLERNPSKGCPSGNSQVEGRVIDSQDHVGMFGSQVEETALLCKKGQRSQGPPNEE